MSAVPGSHLAAIYGHVDVSLSPALCNAHPSDAAVALKGRNLLTGRLRAFRPAR